jgi:hypothetical protein
MPRIRTIKPDFFKHEGLADHPFHVRLAFAGLWTLADAEGRLEDRPRRIKAEIFPYDDVDMDLILRALNETGFLRRYRIAGKLYIQIDGFKRHQRISGKEAAEPSRIPAPPETGEYQSGSVGEAVGKSQSFPNVQEGKGREGNGREGIGDADEPRDAGTFDSETFLQELKKRWPRADHGAGVEHAAFQALEQEIQETGLTMPLAADAILVRISRVAELVSRWPRDQKPMIPGLVRLLQTRRFKQDDCYWERIDAKTAKADERNRDIDALTAGVH